MYSGEVKPTFSINYDATGPVTLEIEHYGKQPDDTVVENGVIVRDRSFELTNINVDGIEFNDLIWQSEFCATDGNVYPSCLFFGPNGKFVINFENPVLKWYLQQQHLKNNNDPLWEEDYNYYIDACKLLTQISQK